MVSSEEREASHPLRLAELLASVSLATDLGTGQPHGHALRTCAIATTIAEEMGCGPEEIRTVHQFALLRFLGCTADAAETAGLVGGDDLAYNAAMAPVVMGSGREMLRRHVGSVAPGRPRRQRLPLLARGLADPQRHGTFAVHALRGRRDARRTKWPRGVRPRGPGACLRALGRKRIPRSAERRRHPACSAHRRRGARRRARAQVGRARLGVDPRTTRPGVRPRRGRRPRSVGTGRPLRARSPETSGRSPSPASRSR